MMRLSTWSALKNTFCYLKNHYWRLLGLYLIMFLNMIAVSIIGGLVFILAYKLNIFEEFASLLSTKDPFLWVSWAPELFTLSKFSVFMWLMICLGIIILAFIILASQISIIKAVMLDHKIELNFLRIWKSRATSYVVSVALLFFFGITFLSFISSFLLFESNNISLSQISCKIIF